ncbi:MAG: type II toxin-antitoxin system RelE family toxin [Pseudomonadota bacterium]
MWKLRYADSVVLEDMPRLDQAIKQRIRKAIETKLTLDPIRFGKPLRHSLHPLRSLRVGDYPVLYHIGHEVQLVSIVSIGLAGMYMTNKYGLQSSAASLA